MIDLRTIRKLYKIGNHITTIELRESLPILEQAKNTLYGLGPEFAITANELARMEKDFADWLHKRTGL